MSTIVVNPIELTLFEPEIFDYIRSKLADCESGSVFGFSQSLSPRIANNGYDISGPTNLWQVSGQSLKPHNIQRCDIPTIDKLAAPALVGFSHRLPRPIINNVLQDMQEIAPASDIYIVLITNFGIVLHSETPFVDHAAFLEDEDLPFPGPHGLHGVYQPIIQNGLTSHEKLSALAQIKSYTRNLIDSRSKYSRHYTSKDYNNRLDAAKIEISLE